MMIFLLDGLRQWYLLPGYVVGSIIVDGYENVYDCVCVGLTLDQVSPLL